MWIPFTDSFLMKFFHQRPTNRDQLIGITCGQTATIVCSSGLYIYAHFPHQFTGIEAMANTGSELIVEYYFIILYHAFETVIS